MIRRERRDGGEEVENGSRERIEIERKETKGNCVNNLKRIRNIDTCLCLFPQGNAFLLSSPTRFCCSSEVLKLSFQRSCSVKGLARRD